MQLLFQHLEMFWNINENELSTVIVCLYFASKTEAFMFLSVEVSLVLLLKVCYFENMLFHCTSHQRKIICQLEVFCN